jgi:hypothetical protein
MIASYSLANKISRIKIYSMNKSKTALFVCITLFLGCAMGQAQLADTIWSGNARVTVPALTACDQNGNPLPYPQTITKLTFVFPVEVWFWSDSKFLIVYRQRDMGADPMRGELQPLIGEWEIPSEARVGLLSGVSVVPYGSDLFEIQTGSYAKKGNKYTFTAEQRDTEDRSGYDFEWIFPDARQLVTGSFTLKGTTLSSSLTFTQTKNPIGPYQLKTTGKNTTATATLTKSSRQPSTVGVDVFLDGPL